MGASVSFQFTNEEFYARSRTIPQDSGIGQPSGCPQGRGAWMSRVKSRDCAEAYLGTSHKQSRRLTPRFRKRAICGWKLGCFSFKHLPICNKRETCKSSDFVRGQVDRSRPCGGVKPNNSAMGGKTNGLFEVRFFASPMAPVK